MIKSKDRTNGKLVIALGRTYRKLHEKTLNMLRERELTFAQFTVLEVLYNKGNLTIQQIIDKVLSSSGNITVVVRNLERLELVKREENPDDRRSYIIGITDKGWRLMEEIFHLHMDYVGQFFDQLTEEEKQAVVGTLKKLQR